MKSLDHKREEKRPKKEYLKQALSRVTADTLKSFGYYALDPKHFVQDERSVVGPDYIDATAQLLQFPLVKKEDEEVKGVSEDLTLSQVEWKNTLEKFHLDSKDIGKKYTDDFGRICKFTELVSNGTAHPNYAYRDVIDGKILTSASAEIRLSELSSCMMKARCKEVLFIARYKENTSIFSRVHLPLDIFKSIFWLCFPKKPW